jgi:hypothetical protein
VANGFVHQLSNNEQAQLAQDMPRSLIEAALLLEDDVFAPDDLDESVRMLKKALPPENVTAIENEIKAKYFV